MVLRITRVVGDGPGQAGRMRVAAAFALSRMVVLRTTGKVGEILGWIGENTHESEKRHFSA